MIKDSYEGIVRAGKTFVRYACLAGLSALAGSSLLISQCTKQKENIEEKINSTNYSRVLPVTEQTNSTSNQQTNIPSNYPINIRAIISNSLEKIAENTSLSKRENNEYLPLEVGNSWTYIRKVNHEIPISYIFSFQKYISKKSDDKEITLDLMSARFLPNISEETYTITNKIDINGKDYALVNVQGDNPRDGRYEDNKINQIIWFNVAGSKDVYEKIVTDNDIDYDQMKPILLEKNRWAFHPTIKNGESEHPYFNVGAIQHKKEIIVPAGIFTNCVYNCTLLNAGNLGDVMMLNRPPRYTAQDWMGFRTDSYYAEEVGLVYEVQYDWAGDITYTLELKEYNVKKLDKSRKEE